MDRRVTLAVIAIANLILLAIWFDSIGGLTGLRANLVVSLTVLAVVVPAGICSSLLVYWRMKQRGPMVVPASSTPITDETGGAVTLVAVRWKVALQAANTLAMAALVVALGIFQPGMCRVASIGGAMAVLAWPIVSSAVCIVALPKLQLNATGLRMTTAWRSIQWSWDEVRDVRIIRGTIPFVGLWTKRPNMMISFRRFQPPGHPSGASDVGIRAMWLLSAEEVGAMLNSARARWATAAGDRYVPVPRTWEAYVGAVARLAMAAGVAWLLFGHPCGYRAL